MLHSAARGLAIALALCIAIAQPARAANINDRITAAAVVAPAPIASPVTFIGTIPSIHAQPYESRSMHRMVLATLALAIASSLVDGLVTARGLSEGRDLASQTYSAPLHFPGGSQVKYLVPRRPNVYEADRFVRPFSYHGLLPLLLIGGAQRVFTTIILERHFTPQQKIAANLAELGSHVWGISTWSDRLTAFRQSHDSFRRCEAGTRGFVGGYFPAPGQTSQDLAMQNNSTFAGYTTGVRLPADCEQWIPVRQHG